MSVRLRFAAPGIASVCGAIAVALAVVPVAQTAAPRGQVSRRQALALGTEAYIYGFPVLAELSAVDRLPVNVFAHIGAPATPAVRLVVLPNADTPYSTAHLDLRAGPIVLEVPSTHGRYYTMQLLDAYTNVFGYVGRRVSGTKAGRYVIVGPGWRGRLPRGLRRISSPTPDAWILGRLLPNGPADLPAVRALQPQFVLTPLSVYEAGRPPAPAVFLPTPPAVVPAFSIPRGLAFFDLLDQALKNDPPPARDRQLLRRLARVGIAPGLQPSHEHLTSAVRSGLSEAAAAGTRAIQRALLQERELSARRHNGWLIFPPDIGRFGGDYLLRAVVADVALAANVPAEAIYPLMFTDRRGRALDGGHSYVVHFAAGQLPPVAAFWSLTVYGPDLFLTPNSINRYALSSHVPGLRRNSGGSLDLFLRRSPPGRLRGNWLPIPSGRFVLALRLFQPRRSALDGRWPLPTVSLVR